MLKAGLLFLLLFGIEMVGDVAENDEVQQVAGKRNPHHVKEMDEGTF